MSHNFLDKNAPKSYALNYFNKFRHALQRRIKVEDIENELSAFNAALELKRTQPQNSEQIKAILTSFLSPSLDEAINWQIINIIEKAYSNDNTSEILEKLSVAFEKLKKKEDLPETEAESVLQIISNIIRTSNTLEYVSSKPYEFMGTKGF